MCESTSRAARTDRDGPTARPVLSRSCGGRVRARVRRRNRAASASASSLPSIPQSGGRLTWPESPPGKVSRAIGLIREAVRFPDGVAWIRGGLRSGPLSCRPMKLPGSGELDPELDARLVARCIDQDPRAWEALVRRHERLVWSIGRSY